VDLFDVVRSCLRRWYVVIPLLLIVAWFSHAKYTSVKPVYYSNAAISIAPPSTRVDQAAPGAAIPRNGLLDVGGATLVANLAATELRDSSVVAQVVAAGGKPDYGSKMFPVPAGTPELPLIMIDATEPDPIAASKTVGLVIAQAGPVLRTLQQQANVPDDQMATAFVVSPPSTPAAGMPSRTRSTIAIFVAGAGLAILVGVVIDVVIMRWKARRRRGQQTRVWTMAGADRADGADTAEGAENGDVQTKHAAANEVAMDSR
jgi:TRAP-type uncharacterized transport system fused permease subunit